MVSEANDVCAFLVQHPPFNHLTQKQLEFISHHILVAFSKSGRELALNPLDETVDSMAMLVVRSGSLELKDESNCLIDRLSAGDYLIPSQFTQGKKNNHHVLVLEDCLYYELTKNTYQTLCKDNQAFATLNEEPTHLAQAVPSTTDSDTQSQESTLSNDDYISYYVKDYMSEAVISSDSNISIRQAAQLMKEKHISSLLIKEHGDLVGIITDSDFRTRVIAQGLSGSEAIAQVMTRTPMYINDSSNLHDAQLKMIAEGVHHLPVLQDETLVGVITSSDVLRASNIEPFSLVRAINRTENIEQLRLVSLSIPTLVVRLVMRDVRALDVGKIITALSDSMTRRLLFLAEKKYGNAPSDYAWLAFGSQARKEQVLGSDQDNGLLLPDDISDEDGAYFKEMTTFVNKGLNICGMPYCPGKIMAQNEKWRLTLKKWKACFTAWIEEPSPKALMHASIFFDMRHIAGNLALTKNLHNYILKRAQTNTIFLAMMSENARQHSPPLGFFKTFVLESDGDHNHTLELKKRGTIPIVDIARNYSLSAGLKQLNTIDRLQAMKQSGVMSKEMADSLVDAHEFIAGIRLEAQGKQHRQGIAVDNYLAPQDLSPLVRHQLKEAFQVVREAQNAMNMRFGGGVI